jgi:cytosine/adenosine deaminase-related metal-dependent hydrolase
MKLAVSLLAAAAVFAAGPPYAITNAKIVASPASGVVEGVIVMRDGLIEAIGAGIAIPPDARIFDGKGLTVYPGLIDAATHYGFATPPRPVGPPAPIPTTPPDPTLGEANSTERYLRPRAAGMNADWSAASRIAIPAQPDPRRNAGFTTVLSIPRDGHWQGTSALVNLAGGASDAVITSPVAMHVNFSTARGGR